MKSFLQKNLLYIFFFFSIVTVALCSFTVRMLSNNTALYLNSEGNNDIKDFHISTYFSDATHTYHVTIEDGNLKKEFLGYQLDSISTRQYTDYRKRGSAQNTTKYTIKLLPEISDGTNTVLKENIIGDEDQPYRVNSQAVAKTTLTKTEGSNIQMRVYVNAQKWTHHVNYYSTSELGRSISFLTKLNYSPEESMITHTQAYYDESGNIITKESYIFEKREPWTEGQENPPDLTFIGDDIYYTPILDGKYTGMTGIYQLNKLIYEDSNIFHFLDRRDNRSYYPAVDIGEVTTVVEFPVEDNMKVIGLTSVGEKLIYLASVDGILSARLYQLDGTLVDEKTAFLGTDLSDYEFTDFQNTAASSKTICLGFYKKEDQNEYNGFLNEDELNKSIEFIIALDTEKGLQLYVIPTEKLLEQNEICITALLKGNRLFVALHQMQENQKLGIPSYLMPQKLVFKIFDTADFSMVYRGEIVTAAGEDSIKTLSEAFTIQEKASLQSYMKRYMRNFYNTTVE